MTREQIRYDQGPSLKLPSMPRMSFTAGRTCFAQVVIKASGFLQHDNESCACSNHTHSPATWYLNPSRQKRYKSTASRRTKPPYVAPAWAWGPKTAREWRTLPRPWRHWDDSFSGPLLRSFRILVAAAEAWHLWKKTRLTATAAAHNSAYNGGLLHQDESTMTSTASLVPSVQHL